MAYESLRKFLEKELDRKITWIKWVSENRIQDTHEEFCYLDITVVDVDGMELEYRYSGNALDLLKDL